MTLPTEGYARWADALSVIRAIAHRFERKHKVEQGYSKIQVLLMDSTAHQLSPCAWDLLHARGYHFSTSEAAYSALTHSVLSRKKILTEQA